MSCYLGIGARILRLFGLNEPCRVLRWVSGPRPASASPRGNAEREEDQERDIGVWDHLPRDADGYVSAYSHGLLRPGSLPAL
jgi:hypothetical protein